MNDKELDEELAKRMDNFYYFTKEKLKIGFRITPDSHNNDYVDSILSNIQF